MSRIETVDAKNWQEFTASECAVLMLAMTTCENCAKWSEELEQALADAETCPGIRFGKIYLDKPGLISFKKANPWLAEVDVLPYNVIYTAGEQRKAYAGAGFERLMNRLRRVTDL